VEPAVASLCRTCSAAAVASHASHMSARAAAAADDAHDSSEWSPPPAPAAVVLKHALRDEYDELTDIARLYRIKARRAAYDTAYAHAHAMHMRDAHACVRHANEDEEGCAFSRACPAACVA
jgi:hypothetical protein